MDFFRKSRRREERKPEVEDLEKLYPYNVMLYKYPPTQNISIQEFEELAVERLKLLRVFEEATNRGIRVFSESWKKHIENELIAEDLKGYLKLLKGNCIGKKESDLFIRRRDYISHFILRLAYCRSTELKRWFISREMEVFKFKFSSLNSNEVKEFLEHSNLHYTPITEEEKNEVKSGLSESTISYGAKMVEMMDFYKVIFSEVLDLIRGRKCYLKKGFAYVSSEDFISIIGAKFQNEIEKGLNAAQTLLPEIENDERLFYMLNNLHTSYTGKDYTITKNSNGIPIEAIDQLSKKSFPLCMRACHEHLRIKHHHKHWGRMQYGLFLKGIGVTLEDSIKFWRQELTKMMELEKFEKEYSYNIRHNYGKEGSMINYSPYSCLKVLTTPVGPQETHGCPFKNYDPITLKVKLTGYGLAALDVQEVCSFASKGHYQIACARYFEITHQVKIDQGINHPNQYFELSQKVMSEREEKNTGNSSVSTPSSSSARKRKPNTMKKELDVTILNDVYDDDELWDIAENQENQCIASQRQSTPPIVDDTMKESRKEWTDDDDFDVSQVMDYMEN